MKKIILGTLCLFIAGCATDKPCYKENCFVTETEITADMQKIRSILLEYMKTQAKKQTEYNLKYVQVTCKLFGKNNKQLNKEIDKLQKVYQSTKSTKENKKLREDLKKSLKGLKLDYKQVLLLAKEIEVDYAKIRKENKKKFVPYKEQALKIVKTIDDQEHKREDWSYGHYEDGLQWATKFGIYYKMRNVLNDTYDKFDSYNSLIGMLESFISEGILIDSFLKDHPSSVSPKDESSFGLSYFTYGLIPVTTKNGEIIFDAVRKAASNNNLQKQELSELVNKTSWYMQCLVSTITRIQDDVTDKIDHKTQVTSYDESKLNNFYSEKRNIITDLVDKNPKSEDFDREIGKLSTRIAYQTYYKVNIARFLYKEWRDMYYSQVKELFVNAVKIADKLQEMIKDEVITDSTTDKRRYEHKSNVKNISIIKEIAKIGVDKIVSTADCYIDSQKEIKDSIQESFIKTREVYLKNLGQ